MADGNELIYLITAGLCVMWSAVLAIIRQVTQQIG